MNSQNNNIIFSQENIIDTQSNMITTQLEMINFQCRTVSVQDGVIRAQSSTINAQSETIDSLYKTIESQTAVIESKVDIIKYQSNIINSRFFTIDSQTFYNILDKPNNELIINCTSIKINRPDNIKIFDVNLKNDLVKKRLEKIIENIIKKNTFSSFIICGLNLNNEFENIVNYRLLTIINKYNIKYHLYDGLENFINEYPNILSVFNFNNLTVINDFLFLGNEANAANRMLIDKYQIKNIINVSADIPCYFEKDINYLRIPIYDCNEDISKYFDQVYNFIIKYKESKILIHCFAGVSRSPTFIISFLMNYERKGFDEIFNRIKQKRLCVDPNIFFISYLKDYETRLNNE
jgi:hypothetical protein